VKSPLGKIALGGLGLVLLLLIATSPLTTALLIKRQAHQLVNDTLVGLVSSGQADINISKGFLETMFAIQTTNESVRQQFISEISELSAQTDGELKRYETSIFDQTDAANYQRLVESRAKFREVRESVIALLEENKRREARILYRKEGLPRFRSHLEAIDTMLQYNLSQAKERGESITRLCNISLAVQLALVAFFFIYAFFVPLVALLERLTRPSPVREKAPADRLNSRLA